MRRVVCYIVLIVAVCAQSATGYLRIHPENPRYFQETTTGEPVLIASCAGVVPTARDCDYVRQIAEMRAKNITYGRVWHFLPWGGEVAIWPWAESSTPGGYWGGRGGFKLDMNTWNPLYWNRLKDAMARCERAGIYCEIHLFDRCGMSPASKDRWGNNPWASDHNINNLETPTSSGDGTPEFYKIKEKPNLRYQQERYVRKMIDETIRFSNIIYEIENEHWNYNNPEWAAYWGKFIKDYISEKYPDSPRLVSYSSLQEDLEAFYDRTEVDIINRHFGNEAERDPDILNRYIETRWAKKKPINIDEFANGVSDPKLLRTMCWIIITSGGHFHIEDCEPSAKPFEVCENIRQFKIQSRWDFIHAFPSKNLVTQGRGYCMANPGKEYVIYLPEGGRIAVKLEPGSYEVRWWDTVKGGFRDRYKISHEGGEKTFTAPGTSDWVLHIKSTR